MRVRFTPRALAELEELLSYLNERSPQVANRVLGRLCEALDTLATHPGIGAQTNNPRLRRLVLRPFPYLLFYEATEAQVIVIGIRHGARNPGAMPGTGVGAP